MAGKLGAAFTVAVMVLVSGAMVTTAVSLLATGDLVQVGVGVGVLLLVGVGAVLGVGEVRLGAASQRLAERLAAEAGCLVSPGEFYGAAAADHVRIAAVVPDDRLEIVARRLGVS